MKKKHIFLVIAIFIVSITYGQNQPWKTHGNNVNNGAFLGTKNNKPLVIKTNNQPRMRIKKNGNIVINKDLRVKGTLYVGDSSLSVGDDRNAQLNGTFTEEIMSTHGQMAIGKRPQLSPPNIFTTIPAYASEVSLGVGGSHHQHKLHIQDQSGNTQYAARIGFTNNITGHASVSDGFTVGLNSFPATFPGGIDEFDAALINQQEDARLLFNTSNAPRMQITSKLNGGFVGIGNYKTFLPQHLLHIHGRGETTGFQITKGELPLGTGHLVSDGFLIEISDGAGTFHTTLFNQEEDGEIRFFCKDGASNPIQIMRMYSNGNIGVGTQTTYTTASPATENLDIERNARIRTMPAAPTPNTFDVVLIDGTGVLHRGDASGFGGADHDWYNQATLNNITTSVNDDIYTFGNVAIGADNSITSRAYVYNNIEKISLYVNSDYNLPSNFASYGIYSWIHGSTGDANAVYGSASGGANFNYGVRGEAGGTGTSTNYAIYGSVISNPNVPYLNYAGYFAGNIAYTGLVNPSDIKIKENITNIDNPLAIIEQLSPKNYNYRCNDYPSMNLPSGLQYGLIAQDVELILPDIVSMNIHPAVYDSLGNVLQDSIHYKGLNYEAFIPILIGAIQEQQQMIDSLYSIIDLCCSSTKSASAINVDINSVIEITPDNTVGENTELFQNKPNPFKTHTTFTYNLGKDGFVELEIHDQYGRIVTKLVDESQTTGKFSVLWETSDIAPGIYFYSLKVDGLVWVKKAIRIK